MTPVAHQLLPKFAGHDKWKRWVFVSLQSHGLQLDIYHLSFYLGTLHPLGNPKLSLPGMALVPHNPP